MDDQYERQMKVAKQVMEEERVVLAALAKGVPPHGEDKMSFNEQKLSAYLLPFVKASAEGKTILERMRNGSRWAKKANTDWDPYIMEYKIEEPPPMVPYEAEDWLKITRVRSKKTGRYLLVEAIDPTERKVEIGHTVHTFEEAAEKFTHLDGSELRKPSHATIL